ARSGALRLQLQRVDLRSGAVRGTAVVDGTDVFELADRATAELATRLGRTAGELRVADVTTPSLAAYRFYEQGLRSLGAGDYERSLQLFDAALAEDSLFAMAALQAYNSAAALGRTAAGPSLDHLSSVAARAAERERLLIRTTVGLARGEPGMVVIAESLSVRYPAEPEGHLTLGAAQSADGDFLGALPHFYHVITADSLGLRGNRPRCVSCQAYAHIANAYMLADSMDAAERITREWMQRQPGSPEAWRWLGVVLAAQGNYDEAAAALRAAAAASRPELPVISAFLPTTLSIKAGDFAAADRLLDNILRSGARELHQTALWYRAISLRNQGRHDEALTAIDRHAALYSAANAAERLSSVLQRAQIHFEQGRFREAARAFDSLAAFSPSTQAPSGLARHKSWMLVHLATTHAATGDTAALKALIEPLRAWGARSGYGRDRRLYHHAQGLLLVARGRNAEAAAEFRRAIYSLN
ncbi:MAG: tetratricopeptide repeat protein, partial [Longimicrobiales bacterium]